MGYIAPNLWPTLEYGEGLRSLVHAGRHLEKWLDFRAFQVFEEATVYTAIQIYSKTPVEADLLSGSHLTGISAESTGRMSITYCPMTK